ncbi:MAG TPA: phospholipase D-like domain-containing protein [Burkholderiaceae bacterium]|nr:phospholipase D-like domain-containing protein [Burkholderiaceae bacterium]
MSLVAACKSLPERGPAVVDDGTPLEQQLVVRDRSGAVAAGLESKVLAAVKAEGESDLTERHLKALAAAGSADFYQGNAARLLLDGPATFAAMKDAIDRARGRVLLESYIVDNGATANEMAALLARKVAQGVQVALVYDGLGSFGTDTAYFDRLAKAGVAVCKFNPVNPLERPGYWGINHRDHRKVLVVDQEVAFTGGINISRVYSSGSFARQRRDANALDDGWRDTQIELRGPVVQAFAHSFEHTWATQGCQGPLAKPPAPRSATAGKRVVQVLESDPRDPRNRIYASLLASIAASRRSVWLTMAYFAPGDEMIGVLVDAAQRGVDVVLVLPGRSDFALVLQAGRSYYDQLLAAGVRIHEMDDAVMHAKTAVIDGVVSTVGSSNMDWRSFVANDEINAIVLGREFGEQLETVFKRDLAASRPIELAAWRQRDLGDRFMEQLGRMAERLL